MSGLFQTNRIVLRSGFLDTLKAKLYTGKLLKGDTIMADKGFDIENDLKRLGLCLNITPFLKERIGFDEGDVNRTQTIPRHRILIERVIGKVRRFTLFQREIPVSMFGSIGQIWSVACFLSNFQNPVLA